MINTTRRWSGNKDWREEQEDREKYIRCNLTEGDKRKFREYKDTKREKIKADNGEKRKTRNAITGAPKTQINKTGNEKRKRQKQNTDEEKRLSRR